MVYCRNMLDKLGMDEDEIINMKMIMNEAKYPVEKAEGQIIAKELLLKYNLPAEDVEKPSKRLSQGRRA